MSCYVEWILFSWLMRGRTSVVGRYLAISPQVSTFKLAKGLIDWIEMLDIIVPFAGLLAFGPLNNMSHLCSSQDHLNSLNKPKWSKDEQKPPPEKSSSSDLVQPWIAIHNSAMVWPFGGSSLYKPKLSSHSQPKSNIVITSPVIQRYHVYFSTHYQAFLWLHDCSEICHWAMLKTNTQGKLLLNKPNAFQLWLDIY